MARLTRGQQEASNAILEGHNLILTGQAGTGKTFLLKEVVSDLTFVDKRVAILCTTGIGCLQYSELGAKTIHSWAGLYDGRYDDATLRDLLLHDENYNKVRQNATECDVVLIDEISMLSKKDFDQLEMVCRTAKGNNFVFGGLQVVVCGDFYQLPPVPNPLYNDSGKFCFLSNTWKMFFTHKIDLTEIVRQQETVLIEAVRESARGDISKECDNFLQSLTSEIPEEKGTVHLFPKNIDAALFNEEKLNEIQGDERVYIAKKNHGPQKYLNKILAPNYLRLKTGCCVMLLRNLGGKLVNGLRGLVQDMRDDEIVIYFKDIQETHTIERYTFTIYDKNQKINTAERYQFPVQLAYGLTIHKSQGMSLDSVIVHCDEIFLAGQLSVAIGRATLINGLQLKGYKKRLCTTPAICIRQFYESTGDSHLQNSEEVINVTIRDGLNFPTVMKRMDSTALGLPMDYFGPVACDSLTAIRSVHANGEPFHLAGYSFGAVVAQEMALRFQDGQSSPSSLILLDGSSSMLYIPDDIQTNETEKLHLAAIGVDIDFIMDLRARAEKEKQIMGEKIERVLAELKEMKFDVTTDDVSKSISVYLTAVNSMGAYQPDKMYKGDVTLIAAEESLQLFGQEPELAVGKFTSGEVTIKPVSGNHATFIRDESGDEVADIINTVLLSGDKTK